MRGYEHPLDRCDRGRHSFCEVDSTGWEICEFCGSRRHPERLAAAQARSRQARVESMPFVTDVTQYQACWWCRRAFLKDDMFRVGKDSDHHRVCGPDCPSRPELEPKPKSDLGRYKVQFTVEVDAKTIEHAKNIVKFELRTKAPRLEFKEFHLTQKIRRK